MEKFSYVLTHTHRFGTTIVILKSSRKYAMIDEEVRELMIQMSGVDFEPEKDDEEFVDIELVENIIDLDGK